MVVIQFNRELHKFLTKKKNDIIITPVRSGLGLNKDLYLFSGSGITEKSNLEDEWMETEQKFNLMLSACNE